jgi:uncharacterized protein YjbI with pentapeptide repeats
MIERKHIEIEELLQQYADGERDFSHIFREGGNLSGQDLCGIDLTNSVMAEMNFTHTKLDSAILEKTHFGQSDLTGASLQGADLSHACLGHAELGSANLMNAKLVGAYLSGASLHYANLVGADLTDAIIEGTYLEGAIFGNTVMPDGSIVSASDEV